MIARARGLLLLGVCLGLAGCRHKAPAPVIPPLPVVPVPLATVPTQTAQLPTEPAQTAPIATVTLPPKPAKKTKKKTAPTTVPVQMASAVTPPPPIPAAAPASASLIGSLAASGDQSAENRQKAVDLISANTKELAALSNETKKKERNQIVRIMNFQQDAQKALNGGDTEGAFTLATKAKVLLDELAK